LRRSGRAASGGSLRGLLALLGPYRRGLVAAVLPSFGAIIGVVLIPLLVADAVNNIAQRARSGLVLSALAIGAVAIVVAASQGARQLVAGRVVSSSAPQRGGLDGGGGDPRCWPRGLLHAVDAPASDRGHDRRSSVWQPSGPSRGISMGECAGFYTYVLLLVEPAGRIA
jgi:hypothetical protein